MTIWLLALLLFTCLVLIGYSQGAIRVGISLIGIIFATLLAVPLGGLIKPALRAVGIANPIVVWTLAPLIVFCLVNIGFKLIAMAAHRKMDLHYRYNVGELRLVLWERTNKRLGACLGLVNGLAYLVLICFVIHAFSYWTVQLSVGDGDSKMMRLLNRMGRDLQNTKLDGAAAAVGKLPDTFFNAADLAGLLFHHPLLEARLSRYPGLLSVGERPEFQTLGSDRAFADLRLRQSPFNEVLANPSVTAITKNQELLDLIWTTVVTNLTDIYVTPTNNSGGGLDGGSGYLITMKSDKFGAREILGRWAFDLSSSMMAYRREKPALPANDVPKIRRWMDERFNKISLVAAPDKMAVIKQFPQAPTPGNPNPGAADLKGNWRNDAGDYYLSFPGEEERKVRISQGKLSFKAEGTTIVLVPES